MAAEAPHPPDPQEEWVKRVWIAMEYTNKIVVEADGYPMLHSANDIRTLLTNAFLAGLALGDPAPPVAPKEP